MNMKGKNIMNNTVEMPLLFLGTVPFYMIGNYKFKGIRVINAVKNGINLGYGIDCATAYGNHVQVGRGIKASGKKRDKIFITSKLYNTQQDNHVKDHYAGMCEELGVDYLDLLLEHWPQTSTYINTWKQMEELYFDKKVKYIGLSNIEIRHLIEIESKGSILPHVVQIERNPLYVQSELISYCEEHGIRVQAYAPLGRMGEILTEQKLLKELGRKYQKTVPQIILKWHIQTNVCPVVRSIRKKRIIENISIWDFQLKDEEVKAITDLNLNYRINDPRKFVRYY